jgi:hypothetical protein
MIRVCVCGGRNYNDKLLLYKTLDKFLNVRNDFIIINGDAAGADRLSTEWAKERNIKYELFPADWKTYKKAAGPIRNKQMIDSHIDLLIAFPGGNGTKNMIEQCKKRNIRILLL